MIRVRRLHTRDMARAREIDSLSFEKHERFEDSTYASMLSDDRFEAFGAIDEASRLVGYAFLERSPGYRLRALAVDPAHRGSGAGDALVRFIVERAPGQVDLLVDADNDAAIRLYKRLGFVEGAPDAQMPAKKRMVYTPKPSG